jgi:hypothetical protein
MQVPYATTVFSIFTVCVQPSVRYLLFILVKAVCISLVDTKIYSWWNSLTVTQHRFKTSWAHRAGNSLGFLTYYVFTSFLTCYSIHLRMNKDILQLVARIARSHRKSKCETHLPQAAQGAGLTYPRQVNPTPALFVELSELRSIRTANYRNPNPLKNTPPLFIFHIVVFFLFLSFI